MPPLRPMLILVALAAGSAASATAQTQDQPQNAGVSLASGVNDATVLTAADSDFDTRFAAARRLIVRTEESAATTLLGALRDGGSPAAQRAVAKAIAAAVPGAPRYANALRDALAVASTPECVADVLTAMNDYPARSMAEAAASRLATEESARVRSLLSAALLRWTACEPCAAQSPAGWIEWWERVRTLDDAGWQAELASNFRARAERLSARGDQLSETVLALYNALYAATPVERRGSIIAAMLRDNLVRANRLGLELASRTLLNAQPLGVEVADAAIDLLSSPDETVRAESARLLENLGADVDTATIVEALTRETSARVAAPLLRSAAREGANIPAALYLRWLAAPDPASSAASDALLALHEDGMLSRESLRIATETLAEIEPERVSASHVRLLALNGPSETLRTVAERSGSATAQSAAARALASDESFADALLEGAANHPSWFEGAARAVELHRPNADAMLALLRVRPDANGWVEPCAKALTAMPAEQRARVFNEFDDLEDRAALLAATAPHLEPREAGETLVLLAETRLSLRDSDGALDSADTAIANQGADTLRARRVRFFALVDLGRLDDAMAATPGEPPSFWLDAL
ncbi:MAG: hypothetical protein ACTS27_11345, partial [Phycisphaerales bacterium]